MSIQHCNTIGSSADRHALSHTPLITFRLVSQTTASDQRSPKCSSVRTNVVEFHRLRMLLAATDEFWILFTSWSSSLRSRHNRSRRRRNCRSTAEVSRNTVVEVNRNMLVEVSHNTVAAAGDMAASC